MYFLPRNTPLDLSSERLHGLRISLNMPVVSIEELPVAPARAVIAIHEEIDGRPNITVGIRSLGSGAAALFSFEGDLRDMSSLTNGIDAALSFGESMGFLFDEDEIKSGSPQASPRRALDLWLELMGLSAREPEAAPRVPAAPAPRLPVSGAAASPEVEVLRGEVVLLEEAALPEDGPLGLLAAEPNGIGPRSPVALSKFRHYAREPSLPQEEAHPGVEKSPPAEKRTALGRLKLVKRRNGSGDGRSKPSVIRRLLSSF